MEFDRDSTGFFEESVASRIFSFMSHPVVDLFRYDKLVREIIKYPTYIYT